MIASKTDHPNVISVSQISKEGFGTNHPPIYMHVAMQVLAGRDCSGMSMLTINESLFEGTGSLVSYARIRLPLLSLSALSV